MLTGEKPEEYLMGEKSPARALKGKELNSGIRGGLWDEKHYLRMGDAIWLFGWLVHRQTTQRNGQGLILRGIPLTYAIISEDTGFRRRTLQRWMATLITQGYISVKYSVYNRMVIRILNAKKFVGKQLSLPTSGAPEVAHLTAPELAQYQPPSAPEVAHIGAPSVAHIGTKSGALKKDFSIEQKLPRNGNTSVARSARDLSPQNGDAPAEPAGIVSQLGFRELKGLQKILLRTLRDRRMPEAYRSQTREKLQEVENAMRARA